MEEALGQALRDVDTEDIAAIGVSGQQHGLVALDANREPLLASKLWCDSESAPQAAELSKICPWAVPAAFTASKIRWLQEERPEAYGALRHVLLPHDYVNFWLTGELAMEVRRACARMHSCRSLCTHEPAAG